MSAGAGNGKGRKNPSNPPKKSSVSSSGRTPVPQPEAAVGADAAADAPMAATHVAAGAAAASPIQTAQPEPMPVHSAIPPRDPAGPPASLTLSAEAASSATPRAAPATSLSPPASLFLLGPPAPPRRALASAKARCAVPPATSASSVRLTPTARRRGRSVRASCARPQTRPPRSTRSQAVDSAAAAASEAVTPATRAHCVCLPPLRCGW